MIQHGSDDYGGEAEGDEAVLHVLHHGGEDNQVRVERSEDGAVDVAALRREKMIRTAEDGSITVNKLLFNVMISSMTASV